MAQELSSRLFVPQKVGQIFTEFETKIRYQEEKYEQQETVQNQTEVKHYELLMSVNYLWRQNQMFFLNVDTIPRGKGEESLPMSNSTAVRQYQVSGLKRLGAGYLYQHRDLEIENLTHGFLTNIYANPFKGKETNGAINRVDLLLEYHYQYLLNPSWTVFGMIGTHVFGKQRTTMTNNDTREDESFTQIETDFGITYSRSQYFATILGLFSQMTNYTSRSPSFIRATDKGYSVGGQIELGYNNSNLWALSIGHQRRSDVFNAISDRIEDDLDYEHESGAMWLKFKYLY